MSILLRSSLGLKGLVVLMWTLATWYSPQAAEAQSLRCLPTCDTRDGRFLAIAGSNLQTLSPPDLNLSIAVPAEATDFQIGVFDGDGGEYDSEGNAYWDSGVTALFEYTLSADPSGDGTGTIPVELLPGQPIIYSNTLPDNNWADFSIPTSSEALTPGGNYFYVLRIRLIDPALTTLNALKIRTSATLSGLTLDPVARPFSYIASWTALSDITTIYPAFPSPTPTTYNGTFRFYFDVPVSQSEVYLWDGDFDHGNYNQTDLDTDDPDTPGAPFTPSWSTENVNPEGVAIGLGGGTGNPADDDNPADFGVYIVRPPALRYSIVSPDGQLFPNNNPSGNQEWERFRIATDSFDPSEADHSASSLPPGTYQLQIEGVDMLNLNALLLPYRVLCVEEDGSPCTPLRPFLVGDRVYDRCGNDDEGGEGIGLEGITLELVDQFGNIIATTVTDEDGLYSFPVEAATYTVRVADSNFEAGGPLDGFISTNGVSETETVIDDNVLTFDFGFCGQGSIGDRVWEDTNGNGVQDPGEPGLPDILVELLDGDGNILDQAFTNGDGEYEFTAVQAGTYTVRVEPGFLPEGLTPSADLDGIATPHEAVVELNPGESRSDVDFGYTGAAADGSIGDRVWADTDGDGVQDAGEPGLPGVTVRLRDGDGNVVATTATDANGTYSFDSLAAGTYSVEIDAATLPAGTVPTYDLDGIGTPNAASVELEADQERTDADFGYRGSASLGDRLWIDIDGDGTQDAGEPGINGVTVELVDGSGTVIATTTTAGDGTYTFSNLLGGSYTVRVVAATLPAGLTPSYDLDGIGTPNAAAVTVTGGVARTDVDFGYRGTASLGDRVWYDVNGNGTQDPNEDGLTGVTVELVLDGNVVATTTTAADGIYTFSNLTGGTYTVRVVATSLPAGAAPTYDLDGVGTPHTAVATLANGASRADVDFGYRGSALVGDRVWYDADGDGTQDAGETGLTGVTVELLDGDGNVLATTTTGANGTYTFGGLLAGTYSVRVDAASLPADAVQTYDLDGVGTPNTAAVTVTGTETIDTVDFGYRGTASIGDRLWNDANGNGAQDAGEAGLIGVTVELLDNGGNVAATTTTGADGIYTFSNLNAGNYTVRVVAATLPAGVAPTYDLDGTGSANTAAVTLSGGQNRTDLDFGYRAIVGTLAIGDRIWNDADGNGLQDAGETGINGVTVQILDGATVLATTVTSGDGNYSFNSLHPGTYTVRIDSATLPANVGPTYDADGTGTPHTATVALAASRTDVDFGYRGSKVVRPILECVINNGNNTWTAYFGYLNENGLPVTIPVGTSNRFSPAPDDRGQPTSFQAGRTPYWPDAAFNVVFDGNNLVWSLNGRTATANQGSTPCSNHVFFEKKWQDAEGNVSTAPPANLPSTFKITATSSLGSAVCTYPEGATALSCTYTNTMPPALDNNGLWVPVGSSYTVTETGLPPGVSILSGTGVQTLPDPDCVPGRDGLEKYCTHTVRNLISPTTSAIGDRLWNDADGDGIQDGGEAGLSGVTIELLDDGGNVVATTTTDANGIYNFNNLVAGSYTVRVVATTLPGGLEPTYDLDGTATTHTAAVTVEVDQARTDVDFGYRTPVKASIGDRVWYDTDGDGVQDADEPGLEGTTVELLNSSGTVIATTTAGSNGVYTFTNLSPGTYTVRIVPSTLPVGGLTPTYDVDGTGTAHTAVVSLSGTNRTDVDFGYRGTRSVGDRVWNDADGDGAQDAGEAGINGVTVRLYLGTTEVASTVTAGNGNYTFPNLPETTFTVRIDTATLPAGLVQTYDLDGLATPHQATFNLTTSRTDVDFGYRTPPVSCTAGYFKDHFNSASFSNNDGPLSWAGAWIETDTAGTGVSSGNVTVGNPYAGYLFLRNHTSASTQPSAARQANLAGAASATLSFSFHVRTAVDPSDAVVIEVSNNGGSSYTVLETLTGFTGTYEGTRNYNISSFIASNTRIRFRVTNGYTSSDELFKLDWVKIDTSCTPSNQNASIGNRVWNDADGDGSQDSGETGINGVTVQLLNSSGTVIATTTTAGNGDYTLGSLAAGNYSVRIVTSTLPAGVTQTYDLDGTGTAHVAAVTLASGQNRTDVDFGYRTPPVSCTAGYFKDHFNSASFSNNDGTLSWAGAWIETDSAGSGVSNGNVTVGSPYAGYLFLRDYPDTGSQPNAARQANLAGAASATLSFVFHVRTGIDPDDAVVIEISNNGGSSYTLLETLTGFTGTYEGTRTYNISSFIASNTRLRFRVTNGYGAGDELFKLDWVKIDTSCTPTSQNGSIGNRVWFDADGDKAQDSGEPGMNGVTVQLLNSSGTVIATTTTSGDGNYTFSNLAAGNYSVRIVTSTLPAGAQPTHDLNGTATPHITAVSLTAGQNRTDADFGYRITTAPGTGTLGYWKNHAEDWPVDQIIIGSRTYTKSQAISLMGTSGKGDKTYDMFKQLVAAKLNVLVGNEASCINSTIASADSWMATYPVGSKVKASSSAWSTAGGWHTKLDDYNNGELCAPHRD
jgi:protocatechuate 3,4-dioxygenase beta subunit/phosphotransferase system IIB component